MLAVSVPPSVRPAGPAAAELPPPVNKFREKPEAQLADPRPKEAKGASGVEEENPTEAAGPTGANLGR